LLFASAAAIAMDDSWGITMRKMPIVALSLVLVLSTAHAADPEVAKVAERAIGAHALMVGSLRDDNCGGSSGKLRSAIERVGSLTALVLLEGLGDLEAFQLSEGFDGVALRIEVRT
jgi:hypothetical protein